jgi:hypothetical protein
MAKRCQFGKFSERRPRCAERWNGRYYVAPNQLGTNAKNWFCDNHAHYVTTDHDYQEKPR